MLILFDIDGTLLLTEGAGIAAMMDAGRELFGSHFTRDGVQFSGRLDTLIWNDLAKLNRIDNHDHHHDTFRAAYGKHLSRRLQENPTAMSLPGVTELVHRLAALDHLSIGLLTGNYPETGRLKIKAAGLDPDIFTVAAWGCDGATRRDLPPVALQRHHQRTGRKVSPQQTVIIGDTPHDIDCAKAHGCRSIGVATGAFTVDVLRKSGADLAVTNLADVASIIQWLESPQLVKSR